VTEGSDWLIYTGAGEPHDRIADLPPPPDWRDFGGAVLPGNSELDAAAADPRANVEKRARNYRPEPSVVDKVNAAMYLRRPLLVTGKPGVGKTTLALSIAWELKLGPVLHWPITSRARLAPGLYQYDAVGRLQDANLRRMRQGGPPVDDAGAYITLGPLGTALVARDRPRVLLIDEFDKSDIDLPNDLLNVLEEGQFTIPELIREQSAEPVRLTTDDGGSVSVQGGVVRCSAFPIIIITSNGERTFPKAFLRRCVTAEIPEPTEERLEEIVRTQLGPDALARSGQLLQIFLAQRRLGAAPPTDRLLNAVYLAMTALAEDDDQRLQMAKTLIEDQGPGDH
jgi:MoxR-like ATPase